MTLPITKKEIIPGCVLFMQPECYRDWGRCSLADMSMINGKNRCHVCIYTEANFSAWVPLFSSPGESRYRLSEKGRYGHPTWTRGIFRGHSQQVWLLTVDLVIASSRDHDLSRNGKRNGITPIEWKVERTTNPQEQYGPMLDFPNFLRVFYPLVTGEGKQSGFLPKDDDHDGR